MANLLYTSVSKFGGVNSVYHKVVSSFPKGMQMAFAYGSGVFKQEGQKDTKQNMMDFIFVVNEPAVWHEQNLKQHASHYSFLKRFGPNVITMVQESAAGLYFNPIVPFGDRVIKYGVISTKTFTKDLVQWNKLYVSGRLHKPVMIIKPPDDDTVKDALKTNLESAIHFSLMFLPEKFSELDLFTKVASLSYTGDFRMLFAEDPFKVENIVSAGIDNFRVLYQPILLSTDYLYWDEKEKSFEQEYTYNSRLYHLDKIPGYFLGRIGRRDVETVYSMRDVLAQDSQCNNLLHDSLDEIVGDSSKKQSLKGILTGGLFRSSRYGSSKCNKWLKSGKK
ncbi:phosphatidate cytidylyltransferase, mitochondrial-like [Mizuhopecten yessoensis]|uniref:Phosphatidate cytidylyltransferase, mitochondrial n=1 Tax=Mizuhopecten yessoensis TaxID=6573 RepID=A0A210PXI4_MIZYE|nr:phosphatidate cytidylyltransferase, mitochondrial-like [Mizuhopecten yessoensis]OWF41191.1 Mitochondrial translocator assembly and maintenance protein 41-like [Mizuhopecten yessoensis]